MVGVRLVAITCGARGESPEQVICHVARVSNPGNQNNFETMPRLLAYCIRLKHWSIFETVTMTLEFASVSVAIAAQILRHRSFTFQQFSARYAEPSAYVHVSARRQADKNRQSSVDDLDDDKAREFDETQKTVWATCKAAYDKSIADGVAREQARFLLPQSTTTTLYVTGSVRSWIHYFDVRMDASTQKEHLYVADAARAIFVEQFPVVSEALGFTSTRG